MEKLDMNCLFGLEVSTGHSEKECSKIIVQLMIDGINSLRVITTVIARYYDINNGGVKNAI